MYARVSSEGKITWGPMITQETTCSMDITFYPFDTQNCGVTSDLWSTIDTEVRRKLVDNWILTSCQRTVTSGRQNTLINQHTFYSSSLLQNYTQVTPTNIPNTNVCHGECHHRPERFHSLTKFVLARSCQCPQLCRRNGVLIIPRLVLFGSSECP